VGRRLSRALLDTSLLIGDPGRHPRGGAISVVTLGELRAGVKLARNPDTRAARQARLAAVRHAFNPLPVDEAVAEHYGDTLATARSAGRMTKATDLLIVATAAAAGRTLLTLDARQAGLAREIGIDVEGPGGS